VRRAIIERTAHLLARREPVTLRSVVDGVGASTMAVYTHFDGMPGLWRAVRQEGFGRLAERLAEVPLTKDPVCDLAALGAAYATNALANPDLYRAMFDAESDLEDPEAADASLGRLAAAAARAQEAGRLRADEAPDQIALRYWATGHGLTSLVVNGVLPEAMLDEHAPLTSIALLVAAGDDPEPCRRSVTRGWRSVRGR
jgi:AcrR family transcriptional regulator